MNESKRQAHPFSKIWHAGIIWAFQTNLVFYKSISIDSVYLVLYKSKSNFQKKGTDAWSPCVFLAAPKTFSILESSFWFGAILSREQKTFLKPLYSKNAMKRVSFGYHMLNVWVPAPNMKRRHMAWTCVWPETYKGFVLNLLLNFRMMFCKPTS